MIPAFVTECLLASLAWIPLDFGAQDLIPVLFCLHLLFAEATHSQESRLSLPVDLMMKSEMQNFQMLLTLKKLSFDPYKRAGVFFPEAVIGVRPTTAPALQERISIQ